MTASLYPRLLVAGIALFASMGSAVALLPEPGNIYYGTARDVFGAPYTPDSSAKVMMIRVIGTLDDPYDNIPDDDIILAESSILAPSSSSTINFILRPSQDTQGGTRYIPAAGRDTDPVSLFIEEWGFRYPVASATNCVRVSDTVPALGARGTIRQVNIRAIDDFDGDCISDTWEIFYFGDTGFGADDNLDGDGMNNLEEFTAGTNPLVSDSIDPGRENRGLVFTKSGNSLTVDWPRDPARTYVLEWSNNLATFTDIPSNKLSGTLMNIVDVTGLDKVFIRVRVAANQ